MNNTMEPKQYNYTIVDVIETTNDIRNLLYHRVNDISCNKNRDSEEWEFMECETDTNILYIIQDNLDCVSQKIRDILCMDIMEAFLPSFIENMKTLADMVEDWQQSIEKDIAKMNHAASIVERCGSNKAIELKWMGYAMKLTGAIRDRNQAREAELLKFYKTI